MTIKTINLDATDMIAGRLCTYIAKQSLLGNSVNVYNAEKAVITGDRAGILDRWHFNVVERGRPDRGPDISRMPDRLLRRMVRGMLPFEKDRGRDAFKRVMCYIGAAPADIKLTTLKEYAVDPAMKYVTIREICFSIGAHI